MATLAGNFSFIIPGKSTLQIAIPKPIHRVPKNIKNIMGIERKLITIINTNNSNANVVALESLFANSGARGDIIAKAINGKRVNKATFQLENPLSPRIGPVKGPIEVSDGR